MLGRIARKLLARQDVISQSADDMNKIKEAERSGADLTDLQVNTAFADMRLRMRVVPEQLMRSFEEQRIRLSTLKKRTKADMAWVFLTWFATIDSKIDLLAAKSKPAIVSSIRISRLGPVDQSGRRAVSDRTFETSMGVTDVAALPQLFRT